MPPRSRSTSPCAPRTPRCARDAAARGALLTPIAKAFSTDIGNEVAYLGVQVHGGMGFIEETGAAQHYRDARITAIYEGTNGIQSIDLVTRKLAANGGAAVWALLDELSAIVKQVEASNDPAFGTTGAKLREALGALERTSKWLLERVDLGAERCAGRRDAVSAAVRLDARRLHAGRRGARGQGRRRRRCRALRHAGAVLRREHHGAGAALERTVTDSAEVVAARMRCCWGKGALRTLVSGFASRLTPRAVRHSTIPAATRSEHHAHRKRPRVSRR